MVLAPVFDDTVQEFEDGTTARYNPLFYTFYRSAILPTWGTPIRDWHLRRYYRDPDNWLAQGAFTGLTKRVISTPWEVKAGKRLTNYYQELFSEAHFGDYGGGWDGFISRVLLDFLTLDFGAVVEIIGGGNPKGPIVGPVTGLAHLDALRCAATGNPEFPIVYWSRKTNKLHEMYHERVARLVDMPDGDEAYYGLGMSALSRMISIVQQSILMSRYMQENMDDLPPSGMLLLNNTTMSKWQDSKKTFEADRRKDGAATWSNIMVMLGNDQSAKVEAQFIPFAQVPDSFNYQEYVEIHVNAVALALGIDRQDLWPLTGGSIGNTATQSAILHSKAQGKTFGDILKKLERLINFRVLPDEVEFSFKFEDTESDKERAEIAQVHTGVAKELSTLANREVALRYLADNVESFRDVLLDESGELIELTDTDPKAEVQLEPAQTVAEDQTPVTPAPEAQPAAAMDAAKSAAGLRDTAGRKDIQATRLNFEADIEDALKAAQTGDMTSRRFDTVFRALIRRHGQAAYEDGLKAGGVEDPVTEDDLSEIAGILAEQVSYVTNLTTAVFEDGISDEEIASKPELWWNMSLMPFYQAGLVSADKNGVYEFAGDDGEESCVDCQRLKGQVHRLRDWARKDYIPPTSNTECGGWRCEHKLVKTTGGSRGGF